MAGLSVREKKEQAIYMYLKTQYIYIYIYIYILRYMYVSVYIYIYMGKLKYFTDLEIPEIREIPLLSYLLA